MRSYLRRIATEARCALSVLAITACCCHADPSPLSNDGSPNASVPIALERAGAPMVRVRVLRLAYPAEGVVEERRRCIAEFARDFDAKRDEDGVVVPEHLVELRDVVPRGPLVCLTLVR